MSRQYPIWNEINSCIYSSGKSYGIRDTGCVTVHVGSSKTNSHTFVKHCITRSVEGDYTIFRFSVDGIILKTGWLHKKPGSELLFVKPIELTV